MSADNWTTCPRCAARRDLALAEEERLVTAMYGVAPVEDFDAARAALDAAKAAPLRQTWREDYEFYGAEDGVLSIRYEGACTTCGLSHKFNDDQPIEGISA